MIDFREIYDISITLGSESIDHPVAVPFSRRLALAIEKKDPFNLSEITMTAHTGTHIDAPRHFCENGKTIDLYPVQKFIFPAHVISIDDEEFIKEEHLTNVGVDQGDALLFKTLNSEIGLSRSGKFARNFIGMSLGAAEVCAKKCIGLVGIDYVTVDKYGDKSYPAHRKLLENNILILEGIDLALVPEGNYTLICLPLKIEGGEAGPTRAVLFE